MKVSTNELLLALRAPNSGWLAALIYALSEALQDPDFGEPQRDLVRRLLDAGDIPVAVTDAAGERLARFEQTVQELHLLLGGMQEDAPARAAQRPKLTVCGSVA